MSDLITPTSLLTLTDDTARLSRALLAGIDPCVPLARQIPTDVLTAFTSDIPQLQAWLPPAQGISQSSQSLTPAGAGFGALTGLAGSAGSFAGGNGLVGRAALLKSALFSWVDGGLRAKVRAYAAANGITAVTDLNSYAAYYNNPANSGGAAFSVLYSPDFATAYWYAYGMGNQLSPASVFAPAGMVLGVVTITAANTATLTGNAAANYPTSNGYAAPAPGADAYGNPVYLGGGPSAQGFAPIKQIAAKVTTAINGTCAVTLTFRNQSGTNENFAATLDNVAAGAVVDFSPATAGDRAGGCPTALSVNGAATAGAFVVVTAAERAV